MVPSPAQAAPIANLSVSDATTFEGGKAAFTVTYTGSATSGPISFVTDFTATGGGVDADGDDFNATPSLAAYTFPGGGGSANTVTVTVQTLVDSDTDASQTFLLTAANGADDPVSGTGTITESATAVSDLTVTDATTWEGGKASFTVTYAGAGSSGAVSFAAVNMGTGVTAESGVDYTATPSLTSYTFPGTVAGGTNAVTVTVQSLVDGDATASETFRLTAATSGSNASVGTGTIFESPATNEIVLSGATTVPETATSGVQKAVTITATATNPQAYDVVIPVKTVDDSAISTGAANRDYTALSSSATIVIPADQTVGTTTVNLWDDTSDEVDTQVFTVEEDTSRATLGGDVLTGQDVVEIGVKDDDAVPTISIADAATAKEGGRLTFPLTLSNPSELGVTATLTALGAATGSAAAAVQGDAAAGVVDFVWDNTPGTVAVPAYAKTTNVMIPVTTLPAATFEGPENVKATLTAPANATLGTPATANGLIIDAEAGQTVHWSTVNDPFNNATRAYDEGDDGTTDKKVYVKFTTGTLPTTLNYTFLDVTATNGTDYVATAGSITVPAAGAAAVSIPVVIKGDRIDEADETFKLVVTDPSGVANTADIGEVTFTITDNDDMPTWTTEDVSVQEGNSGTVLARIPVKLSGPASADATFTTTFNDGSAVDAASTTGTNDFNQPTTTSVTIKAGDTVGYLDVPVNGDAIYEREESFTVDFVAPVSVDDTSPDTVSTARVTISNDDATPKLTFGQFSGLEGGTVEVTGTVVGASQYQYEIGFAAAGNGDNPATAGGVDFTSPTTLSTPVTIPAGFTGLLTDSPVSFVPLSFALKNDNIDEATETFAFTASEATSSLKGFATSIATVKIADDSLDLPPAVSIEDVSIDEDELSVDVAVSLTFTSDNDATSTTQTVTVPYYTVDGSAKEPADYTETGGTLSIPAGTMSKNINIPIKNDNAAEPAENFYVKIATPGPLGATVAKSTGEVIIGASTGTDPDSDAPTLKSLASVRLGAGNASLSGTAGDGAIVELWGRTVDSDGDDYAKITQTTATSSGVFAFHPAMTTHGMYYMAKSNDLSSAAVRVFIREDPDISATSPGRRAVKLTVTGDPKIAGLEARVFRVNAGGRLTLVGSGRLTSAGTFTKTLTGLASGRSYTYKSYVVGDGSRGVLTGYSSYTKTVRVR